MKMRFNRQELADALGAACTVTAVRTPKPILHCVHLAAQEDSVLVSATDLELSLKHRLVQVEVEKPGETVLVADTLARIVRECTDELLAAETVKSNMHIRGTGSHFQIVTQNPADFPPISQIEGAEDYQIAYGDLQRLVEWTLFACARESSRFAINGVLWEVDGERLTLVATDGRRLSCARGHLTTAPKEKVPSAIIPARAMSLFGRLAAPPDAVVGVRVASNQAWIRVAQTTIGTALVEGHFPNYADVIPRDNNRIAILPVAEFQSAIKRAALLTNEESRGVRIALTDGSLTLSSRAPEQGEATISMPARYSGEPMEIGFNPVFLLDALRVTHADELTFALRDANKPGVIKVGEDFLYVVMPVSLGPG